MKMNHFRFSGIDRVSHFRALSHHFVHNIGCSAKDCLTSCKSTFFFGQSCSTLLDHVGGCADYCLWARYAAPRPVDNENDNVCRAWPRTMARLKKAKGDRLKG
jgi:hypothetical protein